MADIFATPESALIPQNVSVLFAVCGALARQVTPETARAAFTYADRLPAEFSVSLVADMEKHNPQVMACDAGTQWAIKNQQVLS